MVDATIERELSTCLERLPVEGQRRVLEFARTLGPSPPRGVMGATLLRFAGTIDDADLDVMARAIEEGCAGIDVDEW